MNEGASWPKADGGWWPTAGFRECSNAVFTHIGYGGWYWSSSRHYDVDYAFYLFFRYDGEVDPIRNAYRSNGLSVRCIERRK